MQRRTGDEHVISPNKIPAAIYASIRADLMRLALDHGTHIALATPGMPNGLSDRDQDNFAPLLAIAELAGDEWAEAARTAACELTARHDESAGIGNDLLSDIREAFDASGSGSVSTVDLIEALASDDESPWSTYNYGKCITPRQLARLLVPYGIKSKTVRLGRGTPKGYTFDQFADAFARYLKPNPVPVPPSSTVADAVNVAPVAHPDASFREVTDDDSGSAARLWRDVKRLHARNTAEAADEVPGDSNEF